MRLLALSCIFWLNLRDFAKKTKRRRRRRDEGQRLIQSQMSKFIRVLGSRLFTNIKSCRVPRHATSIRIRKPCYVMRRGIICRSCRKQAWQAILGSRNRSDLAASLLSGGSRFFSLKYLECHAKLRYAFSVHAPHLVLGTLRVVGIGIVKETQTRIQNTWKTLFRQKIAQNLGILIVRHISKTIQDNYSTLI